MGHSALMLWRNTIRRIRPCGHIVVHLKALQLLHQLLLHLLLGHVLNPLDDYVGRRLLVLQRLADIVSGIDVLTDGDTSWWRLLIEGRSVV